MIVAATCTVDGSKTIACTNCDEKTVETIENLGGHNWKTVETVAASCTEKGSVKSRCTVCNVITVKSSAAKDHAYGLAYTAQGNGTHAKTCAECGAKQIADCTMTSTEMGDMICSACATCGYTVYAMKENAADDAQKAETAETGSETAEAPEAVEEAEDADVAMETKADTVIKRVENVQFEVVAPAPEAAETVEESVTPEAEAQTEVPAPVEYSNVVLVVHETSVEMNVELADTTAAEVKKVLTVSMLKDGNVIQPAATVKLSIPVAQDEVTGLKLVLMTENGELIEIEYEIIDGVVVFETDLVGVFLFVDDEAAAA